ncbi:MAG: RluA family pseudouridine synthase [Chloroflexi bacterium]|nr:RluA family pseudouridine synthase [Chloroflexota bacterium]
MKTWHFVIDRTSIRLDVFIAQNHPELTRSQIQRLIGEGWIRVNGQRIKASLKPHVGDEITITLPPAPPSLLTPESIPLAIVYEDDNLLVVDKPAGLTVHPAPGHATHTLVNALLAYYPGLAQMEGSPRPGIVHRLDKDTSGLMVVAKNDIARRELSRQIKERTLTKKYLALLEGHLATSEGVIEAPVGRDPHHRQRMAVVSGGREARTVYRVLDYLEGYTLVEIAPETGRTHQIRVHFSAIGHPLVGDAVYGRKPSLLGRHFLHAHKLGFCLPGTGEYREWTAPLPAELKEFLESL